MLTCIPGASQRMWALQKLRRLISVNAGQTLNVTDLLSPSSQEGPDQDSQRPVAAVRETPGHGLNKRRKHLSY